MALVTMKALNAQSQRIVPAEGGGIGHGLRRAVPILEVVKLRVLWLPLVVCVIISLVAFALGGKPSCSLEKHFVICPI